MKQAMKFETITNAAKKTSITLLTAFAALVSADTANAQSNSTVNVTKIVYTINESRNWSDGIPAKCSNCAISISKGMMLTIDKAVSCENCSFQGGTLAIKDLAIQFNGNTASFNGTDLMVSGNEGAVVVNSALSLTGSTFIFNDASSIKTNSLVSLSASRLNLYDNSTMIAEGGKSNSVSLSNSSQIVIGNGIRTSASTFTVNGPACNIYDNSSIVIGNQDNSYSNLSKYNTANSADDESKSYATAGSTINCGSGYANNCSTVAMYGPALLSSAGAVSTNSIPVVLVGFSAALNNDKSIGLDWNTKQEVNAGHFDIMRSNDGSVWNTIGSVKAKGYATTESDYSFTDMKPASGINYYRLKLVNLDGSFGYTDMKVVRSSIVTNISFFPNPATDYVNISLGELSAKQTTVRLINQAGQVLQEKTVAAGSATIVSFPVQNYKGGLYILSIASADGTHESSKLLINRS
jgi:hypothetical protein